MQERCERCQASGLLADDEVEAKRLSVDYRTLRRGGEIMMRIIKLFVLTVILMTLVIGVFDIGNSSAAVKKTEKLFSLCSITIASKIGILSRMKRPGHVAPLFLTTTIFYIRDMILSPPARIVKVGTWFRWQKSFFMHQLLASSLPDVPEPGLPVYGGSLSGTTGQGFMTKTTRTYEWPVCWYIKPITKAIYNYCPRIGERAQLQRETRKKTKPRMRIKNYRSLMNRSQMV